MLAGALAALMLALAIGNLVAAGYFPSNAPVEGIYAFGISVDFFIAFLLLGIRLLIIFRRPRALAAPRSSPGGFAITGLVISVLVVGGWLWFGGLDFLLKLFGGLNLRYYLDVNGMFFFGIPWALGLFFSASALRLGRGEANNGVAIAGIVVSLLLVLPTMYSGIAYAMGLTD